MSKGIDVSGWQWEAHYYSQPASVPAYTPRWWKAGFQCATDSPMMVPEQHYLDLEDAYHYNHTPPRVEMLKCAYCRSFAPWGTTHCPQCGAPVQY